MPKNKFQEVIFTLIMVFFMVYADVVNITLHFFLKDIRPMLPPAMNHSIAVS